MYAMYSNKEILLNNIAYKSWFLILEYSILQLRSADFEKWHEFADSQFWSVDFSQQDKSFECEIRIC